MYVNQPNYVFIIFAARFIDSFWKFKIGIDDYALSL